MALHRVAGFVGRDALNLFGGGQPQHSTVPEQIHIALDECVRVVLQQRHHHLR